jgi:hypothetical protein
MPSFSEPKGFLAQLFSSIHPAKKEKGEFAGDISI